MKTQSILGIIATLALVSITFSFAPHIVSVLASLLSSYVANISSPIKSALGMSLIGLIPSFFGIFTTCAVIDCSSNWELDGYKVLKIFSFWLIVDLVLCSLFSGVGFSFILSLSIILCLSALIVLSSASIIASIFSLFHYKKLGSWLEKMLVKMSFSNKLKTKWQNYFSKRKEVKESAKVISDVEHTSLKNKSYNEAFMNFKSLITTIAKKEHTHVGFHLQKTKTLCDEINEYVLYIQSCQSLDTIEANNEMVSLVEKTLPQILVSYEKALKNATLDEQIKNTEKMNTTFSKMKEYTEELANSLKEIEKKQNDMSFDSTLQFAENRFKLKMNQ